MAQPHGFDSYVAWGPQAAFGTAITPANVMVPLRAGPILAPRIFAQPRASTGVGMPKRSQQWNAPKLVDWSLPLEWISGASGSLNHLGTLINSVMGHYLKAAGPPVVRTVNIANPPIDAAADTATDFYGRALTIQHVLRGARAYSAYDCVPTSFSMICEAGNPIRTETAGVGSVLSDIVIGSAVAYAELTGTIFNWSHGIANGIATGFWLGTANPLTAAEAYNLRRATITVNPNLRIDPFLGLAASQQYKIPARSGYPEIYMDVDMDFEQGLSAFDAADAVTAFIGSTGENAGVIFQVDANNIVEFRATAATAPGLIEDPRINYAGDGAMGFSFRYRVLPETLASDVFFKVTSPA